MSEKEPSMKLKMGNGKSMELTHRNTTLFTFMGKTVIGDLIFDNASANHIFVQQGKNEKNQMTGMYLFQKFHPIYEDISQFVIENELPSNVNHRLLPECDLRAYMGEVDKVEALFHAQLEGVQPEDFIV